MIGTLFVLAAATPDLAFDGYAKCAHDAAVSYKGSRDSLEVVVGKVDTDCAGKRDALLQVAPDKRQATEWTRMTATQAVTEHIPGLQSDGSKPEDGQKTAATQAASRYPKLDAYRLCGTENAAKTAAERPYNTAESIATSATASCEKELKAAAEETVAEMRQPRLRPQVILDFRRRSIVELTAKVGALRAGGKDAVK